MLGSVHYFLHGYGRSPAGTAFVLFDPDDLYELCGVSEVFCVTGPRETILSLTDVQREPSDEGGDGVSPSDVAGGCFDSHRNTVRKKALSVLLLRYAVGQWPTLHAVLEVGMEPTELRLSSLGACACEVQATPSDRVCVQGWKCWCWR
jgi:hypothetical protein